MGIEVELAALFVLHVLGTSIFGVFETETPWCRLAVKWGIVAGLTLAAYRWLGHWALTVVALPVMAGLAFHFTWCARNGIDPFDATPRRRYYELRGWEWRE
ncbi:MAG: hypothetical protein R3195_07415 [Gemmatimonadota bacterium]|nr:hypothetical protein [Gemmatimonadota bacterium]